MLGIGTITEMTTTHRKLIPPTLLLTLHACGSAVTSAEDGDDVDETTDTISSIDENTNDQPRSIALEVTVIDDGAIESLKVKRVFETHGVTQYHQAYPGSKLPELLAVHEVRCEGCDLDALARDLEATGAFSDIAHVQQPIELGLGNPGGYDPQDWMWQEQAQDWLWHLVRTEADLAWNMTHGDPDVLIAVVDSGFDVDHPELMNKMESMDPYTGEWLDLADHGTAVAAMAAGETAEQGTAPDGILPSVGFNTSVQGLMWGNGVSAAHYAALMLDADVINISWLSGCNPNYGGSTQLAIKEILDHGTAIVAAAGNGVTHCDGQDIFPFSGLYDERIIVVTSSSPTDTHDYGVQTHSHYPRVDLAAPGYDVMVAMPSSDWDYYGGGHGTSFAAPFVAGTVGLMKSVNRCLTPAAIQEILKNSTDPLVDAADFPGQVGTGRVNVNRAVALAQSLDYACLHGGVYDGVNCHVGTPPYGTNARIYQYNYVYTPKPGPSCPYPGSQYDGLYCVVKAIPDVVEPFIMGNRWYYESCIVGGWTGWLNRDGPLGSGDWETLADFADVCDEPQAIQCRVRNGPYWTQSTDTDVVCERDVGLVCRRSDQEDGHCEDYEVRFFCPEPDQDTDGDGVMDREDRCMWTLPGQQVDTNGCSLDGSLTCNDGTASPSCTCSKVWQGCCSHHGGVAGCG